MQAFNVDVQDRIPALVKSILEQAAIATELTPESLLVDVGLTLMDMVNLMLGVEAEFDFTIPQAEITPENFQSIKTLDELHPVPKAVARRQDFCRNDPRFRS
jgi:acyl carrier protein